MTRHLVVGIGNTLMQDDGLGPRCIEHLERTRKLPPSVTCLDVGTEATLLLEELHAGDDLILIDAMSGAPGQPPGTLVKLERNEIQNAPFGLALSPHSPNLAGLLAVADLLGVPPANVRLLGLVTQSCALGTQLTPALAKALPTLADAVLAAIGRQPRRAG
jgi:hydrogenase maturation protease